MYPSQHIKKSAKSKMRLYRQRPITSAFLRHSLLRVLSVEILYRQVDDDDKNGRMKVTFCLSVCPYLFSEGNDSYSTVAFILAIIFVAIANILLLNVLIALFK